VEVPTQKVVKKKGEKDETRNGKKQLRGRKKQRKKSKQIEERRKKEEICKSSDKSSR
jgi:hypothetical protein